MGRIRGLWAIPVLLLIITGCENSLQNYISTNLFGPPYNLEVARLSAQGAIDFGFSVDIDGDYIIVGAPAEYNNTLHPEAVYIYHKTTIDTWDSGCELIPSDWQAGDNFGYSVALYGDYAAVGAPHKTVNSHDAAGAVYIFKRTGTNSWEEQLTLTQDDLWSTGVGFEAVNYALFGSDVNLYGNWLLIAARQDDLMGSLGSNFGAVYAFKNTGSWTYDEQLTADPDEQAGARFGWSLDMNSDYIAVGALAENTVVTDSGAVHIFQFIIDGWEHDVRITAPDGEADDAFGCSVSIGDGFLAVSAPYKTVDSADLSGKVYIFQNSSSGTWSTVPFELTPGTSHENDWFGMSVSLGGNLAIVGSVYRDEAATDSGAAYIYTRDSGNIWELQKTLTPADAAVGTYFGQSIAIGNTYAVIGATNIDQYHTNGGAYVFR